jgi:putative Holliday junction resolvase
VRILALDYGSARCGCAVSDPTETLATPLDPVERPATKRGMKALLRVIRETGAERIVVGLPLSLSGGDSAQTEETRAFAQRLADTTDIPVDLYDERLTTRIAQRSGGRASEDSRAAAHLLEGWLAYRARRDAQGS